MDVNVQSSFIVRRATRADLPAIVALFADDALGSHGDTTDPRAFPAYEAAFAQIEASANDQLYVAELRGEIAGTFQTTLTPGLTGRGRPVFTIESVQTRADLRGQGVCAAMIAFAVERAREAGARLVQLSSNAARTEAHRFYKRCGFVQSHVTFKMKLLADS